MRYHLINIDETKREIYMVADEDESCIVTINATDEAWTGNAADLEILNAPDGATVYYIADDGTRTYKNYRFENGQVNIV